MNLRLVAAALFLLSGVLFLLIGLQSQPRQPVYLVLGVVFIVLAVVRFRQGRRQ